MKKHLLLFFILTTFLGRAQERYFSDPLDIPLRLSGSFAELRSNHFHSGIDIKTQGTTGLPIYAVADGFISRLSVSPTGFGKALYIDHPNGTTSVYGHLERFSPEIQKYVIDQQYDRESFRVDLKLPPFLFPVEQGQEIAKSGNSGSSGGPHLHFEIRDTRSEEPLNPLDFGFSVADQTPPKMFALLVVPLSDTSNVDGQADAKSYPLVFYDGAYHISGNPTVTVHGPVGFAVQANDYLDGSYNKCGINQLRFSVDGETRFAFSLDRFSFDDSRYINSHIVYEEYIDSKRRFIKTWIDPGNQLPVYTYDLSQGIFQTEKEESNIEIELEDSYGNPAALKFRTAPSAAEIKKQIPADLQLMAWNEENHFESENCQIDIPSGALYKDFLFSYREDPASETFYSDFLHVHSNHVPLHKAARLKIKAENLPVELQSKILVVNLDTSDGSPSAAGGVYQNGWVETEIRALGMYALMVDTVAPDIVSLSIADNALTESGRIRFTVKDDLSGIDTIEGRIDGKWALFDYDPKNKRITHIFDPARFEMGKRHHFELRVTDYCGNGASYEANFWK